MSIVQRFERRLEGLLEGAFAKVFKGVVEPVEIASALQKEAETRKAIVGPGRTLVPNAFTVELGPSDHERLAPYDAALTEELAAMLREHAEEVDWVFAGPVRVTLDRVDDLETGIFRVRSDVAEAGPDAGSQGSHLRGRPRLLMSTGGSAMLGSAAAAGTETVLDLTRPVTLIGRGRDVDLRLDDTGVSRHHAEVRLDGEDVVLVDLGSTNGTRVNGRPITRATLVDRDRIALGETTIIFRRDAPGPGGTG